MKKETFLDWRVFASLTLELKTKMQLVNEVEEWSERFPEGFRLTLSVLLKDSLGTIFTRLDRFFFILMIIIMLRQTITNPGINLLITK